MTRIDEPVLIVGVAPVGLMGALSLAGQGVDAGVIDDRLTPRRASAACVVNARPFEICRTGGVGMQALTGQAS